jgi:hypothetical protein
LIELRHERVSFSTSTITSKCPLAARSPAGSGST